MTVLSQVGDDAKQGLELRVRRLNYRRVRRAGEQFLDTLQFFDIRWITIYRQ